MKLKQKGFDVISLSEKRPRADDKEVLSIAVKEKRVLITFDHDFGELIFRFKKKSSGIILLKIYPQKPESILPKLVKVFNLKIDFENSFCIIEINRIRVIPISPKPI